MSEDKKPFTVNDRRHFHPDGEARAVEEEQPRAAAAPAVPVEAPQPGPTHETAPAPEGVPLLDFTGLLVFLGAQAQLLLGGGGESAEAGEAAPDLTGARAFITLLETLEQKTEGRRSSEEDRVLEGLLYQLRLEYVARSKSVGA